MQAYTDTFREMLRKELNQVLPEILANTAKRKEKEPEYLNTEQVSKITGLSVSYFQCGRSRAASGEDVDLPKHSKIGRRVLYKRAHVLEWIERRGAAG